MQRAKAKSDQGLKDTIECINGEQRPWPDLAHAQDDVNPQILWMLQCTWRWPYIPDNIAITELL